MKKGASITPKRLFFLAVLIYTLLFVIYYPPFYTTLDEMGYIKGAIYLKGGEVGTEDHMLSNGFIFTGRDYVPINYGMSIFFVLVHFFKKIKKKRRKGPVWTPPTVLVIDGVSLDARSVYAGRGTIE